MRTMLYGMILILLAGTCWGAILTPDETIMVSADGTRDNPGTVDGSRVADHDVFVRERLNAGQTDMRVVAFVHFDLGGYSSAIQSATFQATFAETLNSDQDAIGVGRVQDDGANGGTWDDSGAADTVPLFAWAANSADQQTLVSATNVGAENHGTYSIDVTSIVNDWIAGTNDNNGLVLFHETLVYQGAGLDSPQLNVTIPEPATLALLLLALGAVGLRRLRRAA